MRYSEFSNEQINENLWTRGLRAARKGVASIGAAVGGNKAKGAKKRLAATQRLVKQYMQYAGAVGKEHNDKKTIESWIASGKSPFDPVISAPLYSKWNDNYDNFIELLYTRHVEKGMIEAGDQEGQKNDTSNLDLKKLTAAARGEGINITDETRTAWRRWANTGYKSKPDGIPPELLHLFGAMLKDGKLKGS